ncbi:MAG: YdiY family protein [Opitutales bacterium]
MRLQTTIHTFLAIVSLAGVGVTQLTADTVETRNGARLVGKVTKIEDGKVFVTTDYAGDLIVKQSEVTGISTDAPVVVRLASGTTLQGTVASQGDTLKIAGPDGELSTHMDKVAATWVPGAEDPQIVALKKAMAAKERHWAYEVGVDVSGKTGNSQQLGTAMNARATLKTADDTLQFYTAYNRQVSDGAKSADQFDAGIDYQNNYAGRHSWYLRDESGFDRVKGIDLYNVAAVGIGYDLIKKAKHTLTARSGFSFRYEGYKNPAQMSLKTAGLDFGLAHEWEFSASKLVNRLAFVPSFNQFSNFTVKHESYYEVPLAAPAWKLRLGLSNDYNSEPGPGIQKLDTSYFTRLVLNWQ